MNKVHEETLIGENISENRARNSSCESAYEELTIKPQLGEHIREAQRKTLIIALVRISRNETLESKLSAHIKKRTLENEFIKYLEVKTLVGCTYTGIAYKTLV